MRVLGSAPFTSRCRPGGHVIGQVAKRAQGPARLRSRSVAAIAVAVSALALGVGAAPAAASTQYFVTVSDLNGLFDRGPESIELRVSPALPAGAYLSGGATCSEVDKPGNSGTEPLYPYLQPGSYQFATGSCHNEESNPLTLHGVEGSLQILGGVYNIKPDPTEAAAGAVESETEAHVPVVTFAAEIIDTPLDNSPVAEQHVQFTFEHRGGFQAPGCEAVTTSLERLQETGQSVGVCRIEGKKAEEIKESDGVWQAYYAGNAELGPSSTHGQVPAKLSLEEFTKEREEFLKKNTITIVERQVPPNCERHTESVGLIAVSLGELNCSELKILEIATQVVFAATVVLGADSATLGLTSALIKTLSSVLKKVTPPQQNNEPAQQIGEDAGEVGEEVDEEIDETITLAGDVF